jgi:outer membrane protein
MKKKETLTVLLLFLTISGGILTAQDNETELRLSLKEAQEYALHYNKMVKSAKFTVEASKKDIWTTISSGLPQVSAGANFTDNFKLGVFVLTMNDVPATIIMGTTYNIPVALQASMPLFSANYYIGIETSKLARKMAESNLQSTEIDTRQAVTSAYYLILISEESLRILKENLSNLRETLKSTRAMYHSGLAESTDVDQMASNVTMMENSFSNLQNTIEMNYNLLRFQLGVKSETRIILTENIDDLVRDINVDEVLAQNFNPVTNIQYDLVDKQEKMSALELRSQKAMALPSLSGVYSTSTTGMAMKMSELKWYPSSFLGFNLSVPIFASGQRYSGIQKAKINLEKARNTKEMVSDQLQMQDQQLRYNLQNANIQYKSQKGNVDVSKRVYASMENKYKQGMASSLDLIESNGLFLQAESNYISSLLNLLQTKLSLDKLLNNLN